MNDISLFALFATFFYIGLFTIGGGLVAVTLMQEMIVDRGLISPDQFYNMLAISESTPGPIGVNMATFLGFQFYGIPGAVITTAGEVLPSIIVILIIAKLFLSYKNTKVVQTVFIPLRPAATGLMFVATFNVLLLSLVNIPDSFGALKFAETWKNLLKWKSLIFYALAVFLNFKTKLHPVILVALGAIFGIIFL